jgi:nucleoside 2-deoxyribosyltransferase
MPPAVYVASPLGFSTIGRAYYQQTLLPTIKAAGLRPLDPWAPKHAKVSGLSEALKLPLGDERVALLAVVDGNDIDSGTAAEIGAASALGKPVVGLRTDFRSMGDNDGSPINLQVEFFIRNNGGAIYADPKTAATRLLRLIEKRTS